MTALLMVRAKVDPSVRDAFDAWYRAEHLPDAHKGMKPDRARRGWSRLEENTHIAFYEFPDLAAAEAAVNSERVAELIAEFDRHWDGKVTRTREVLAFDQEIR